MQTAKTVLYFNVSTGPDLDALSMSYKIPEYCRDEEHSYHYSFVMKSFPILPVLCQNLFSIIYQLASVHSGLHKLQGPWFYLPNFIFRESMILSTNS